MDSRRVGRELQEERSVCTFEALAGQDSRGCGVHKTSADSRAGKTPSFLVISERY